MFPITITDNLVKSVEIIDVARKEAFQQSVIDGKTYVAVTSGIEFEIKVNFSEEINTIDFKNNLVALRLHLNRKFIGYSKTLRSKCDFVNISFVSNGSINGMMFKSALSFIQLKYDNGDDSTTNENITCIEIELCIQKNSETLYLYNAKSFLDDEITQTNGKNGFNMQILAVKKGVHWVVYK